MTQEDKKLLLKDLCARLPYGVILDNPNPCGEHWDELISIDVSNGTVTLLYDGRTYKIEDVKPYLRSMSSMTEEEADEFEKISDDLLENGENTEIWDTVIDWLNAHHFDHRGLIEKSLAIIAPDNMYK